MKIDKTGVFMVVSSIIMLVLNVIYEVDNSIIYYIMGVFFLGFGVFLLIQKNKENDKKKSWFMRVIAYLDTN